MDGQVHVKDFLVHVIIPVFLNQYVMVMKSVGALVVDVKTVMLKGHIVADVIVMKLVTFLYRVRDTWINAIQIMMSSALKDMIYVGVTNIQLVPVNHVRILQTVHVIIHVIQIQTSVHVIILAIPKLVGPATVIVRETRKE